MTYHGFEEPEGPVRLEDGRWEGAPLVQGGAARPSVVFVRDFRLVGDVEATAALRPSSCSRRTAVAPASSCTWRLSVGRTAPRTTWRPPSWETA